MILKLQPYTSKSFAHQCNYICNLKLDICQRVALVSMFMKNPRLYHLLATKIILRYMKGTTYHGVLMSN